MYRTKLFELSEQIDQIKKNIEERTKNISLTKSSYLDEIRFLTKIDKLNKYPTYEMMQNSYLNILNSRVMKQCDPPEPEKVFNAIVNQTSERDELCTQEQTLSIRPQPNLCYSQYKLPNPMKLILGFEQLQEIRLQDKDKIFCLMFEQGSGESSCQEWTINTGAEINDFEMFRPQSKFTLEKHSDSSIPWEPYRISNPDYKTP